MCVEQGFFGVESSSAQAKQEASRRLCTATRFPWCAAAADVEAIELDLLPGLGRVYVALARRVVGSSLAGAGVATDERAPAKSAR